MFGKLAEGLRLKNDVANELLMREAAREAARVDAVGQEG